jgi:hypothetical protein
MSSKKITQDATLSGESIDQDVDFIPIVDGSVSDVLKNKKTNLTELFKRFQEKDTVPTGVYRDMGGYDASSNTYPATGGSGSGGAIEQGNTFEVTVASTTPGLFPLGSTLRALVDTPGQTVSNWRITY